MGHQVNFHATPDDIANIERTIGLLEPMDILHSRSPLAAPRIVPSVNIIENGQRWLFFFLVRRCDLGEVLLEHVPAQGHWSIDQLRSPVVQFNSCYFDRCILRRGRMYYVDGYFGENGLWTEKPESFRLWAKALLKATKKVLKRHGNEYIGQDALTWLQREHGKLLG
jgi:hypothetical protein